MATKISECIVVLDTGPVRDLAHCLAVPKWVSVFNEMRAAGYRFSLTDHACAELINQRNRGSIDDYGYAVLLHCLEHFLNPDFPVMLGGRDLLLIMGAREPEIIGASSAKISQRAWSELSRKGITQDVLARNILEESRTEWKDLLERVEALYIASGQPADLDEHAHPILEAVFSSMDTQNILNPPLSTRLDLRTRYFWRQFVRTRKRVSAYNPNSRKKRNDGIDFTVYAYLGLPALAVVTDSGFFGAIEDISSFQKDWFYTPEKLADAWIRGDNPSAVWP